MGKQISPRIRKPKAIRERSNDGRYVRGFAKVAMLVTFVASLGALGALGYGALKINNVIYVHGENAGIEKMEKESAEKVRHLQDGVLETLSVGCESKGVKEPDATIILDSNSRMSIGRFQFQITTVQHYHKKFYGNEISRAEAISIAISKDRATELARKIIFEETGGIGNWVNCAKARGLVPKVEIIKQLMNQ